VVLQSASLPNRKLLSILFPQHHHRFWLSVAKRNSKAYALSIRNLMLGADQAICHSTLQVVELQIDSSVYTQDSIAALSKVGFYD